MKVYCAPPLESPHRGDSNENTKFTIFSIKKKITLNDPKYATTGLFSKGIKKESETAVVNEPSVFEPLKFYLCSPGGSDNDNYDKPSVNIHILSNRRNLTVVNLSMFLEHKQFLKPEVNANSFIFETD